MPVDKTLKVGDRANESPHPPIILNRDWTMEWGQKITVHARNKDNDDVEALKDGMHGFYVYKISCKCDNKQRSGLESLIKIGRSAAPGKAPKDAKEDGTVDYGGIRSRLITYPQNYSMNDTQLLMVLLFKHRTHAMNFESTIKGKLKKSKKYKGVGTEWFDAKYEKDILDIITDYREEQKKKYVPTPGSTPAPEAAPQPSPSSGARAGGSGNSGGRGVVVGTGTLTTVAQAESRQLRNHISRSPSPQVLARTSATGRIYQSRPPPPQTASLADKKKFAKLQGMKKRTQLDRDNKTAAEIRQGDFDEQNKWYRYYGLPQSAGTRMGA